MSDTTHTPGPWKVVDGFITPRTPETAVAKVTSRHRYGSETVEANARLIAAAPDLLEALLALLATDVPETRIFATRKACDAYELAVRDAHAAIAKARGTSR